jgi:hypothetical protein
VPSIRDLSETTSLSGADAIPVSLSSQSDARKASLTTLLAFIEANFASPDFTTQINAPSSSGSSIALADQTGNLWLIINPTGAFAALTLVLPIAGNAYDGQQILVTCSNSIGTLTINGNGATLVGAPTALGVGGFFTLRYNKLQSTWYCVSQSLGSTSVFDHITLTSDTGTVLDVNGQTSLELTKNYAGVTAGNFVRITNRATGSSPAISAQGADANVGLSISAKGTGAISLTSTGTISISAGAGSSIFQGDTVTLFGNVALALGGETAALSANGAAVDMSGGAGGVAFGRSVRILKGTLAQANSALSLYADDVGARATITDATVTASGNFGAVITGGGANIVPAYHDGTNWRIG